eukprot:353069-Chlamydomonas_euryale.AAC.24
MCGRKRRLQQPPARRVSWRRSAFHSCLQVHRNLVADEQRSEDSRVTGWRVVWWGLRGYYPFRPELLLHALLLAWQDYERMLEERKAAHRAAALSFAVAFSFDVALPACLHGLPVCLHIVSVCPHNLPVCTYCLSFCTFCLSVCDACLFALAACLFIRTASLSARIACLSACTACPSVRMFCLSA